MRPGAVGSAAGVPAVKIANGDGNLGGAFSSGVNDSTAGYDHVVQIRLEDSGPGQPASPPFWASDVYIDTTAGTWTQLFPAAPVVTATSVSAITANPATPAPADTASVALSATLSAADSSHPAGSVHLFNGSTDLGAAALNATTGAITATATLTNSTDYSFTFKFTPTGSSYSSSSSAALAYHVNGPAVATTTVVSGPTTGSVGAPLTYTAAISPAAAAGKVQFKVNGTNSGNPVTVSGGTASFTYTPATTDGGTNVVVTAAFTPTNAASYNASADATGVTTAVSASTYTPDPQNVTVTVPQGTLVISTPYTAANPFNLGTLALSADGTHYSVSGNFGDPAAAAVTDPGNLGSTTLTGAYPASKISNGVTVTDTRAGSTGWTASVSSTDFTNSGAVQHLGPPVLLHQHHPEGDPGQQPAGRRHHHHVRSATSATGGPFAKETKGTGTIAITGKLGLDNVPTSVQPGDYTATLTFTIA